MKKTFLKKTKNKEKGFAVLLSILVLASITGLVITVANVSFGITKSNQSIINSEKAFFAAETAAEITIYDIVNNNGGLGLPDRFNQPLINTGGATWSRQVRLDTTTLGLCSAPTPKPVCGNDPGGIVIGNEMKVTLNDGESFQLDLNITGGLYPSQIFIKWGPFPSRVFVAGAGEQVINNESDIFVPTSGILQASQEYRFRIINDSGSPVTYEIQNLDTVALPLGLNISATGFYQGTERRIDLTRPAWLIY